MPIERTTQDLIDLIDALETATTLLAFEAQIHEEHQRRGAAKPLREAVAHFRAVLAKARGEV